MRDIEKIYFVVSFRDHRTGNINYQLGDNFTQIPRGGRRVFGTGHYNRELAVERLRKCEDGLWFKEQRRERKQREAEDARLRKRIHREYVRSLKRR